MPFASSTSIRNSERISSNDYSDLHSSLSNSGYSSSPFKVPTKPAVPLYIPSSARDGSSASTRPAAATTPDTPLSHRPAHDLSTPREISVALTKFTPEMFERAYKMNEPIESSPEADKYLIDALVRCERRGVNYCGAFESLHGVSDVCRPIA